jgi:hypothetical protein
MPMPDPVSAIVGSAVIGAGSSLLQGGAQASAAKAATKAQEKAAAASLALQKKIFETNIANITPWLDAGKQALGQITSGIKDGSFDLSKYGYQDLIQDPGYDFRLQQGVKALDRSAAATGNLVSGDQLKAVTDYGQAAASQEFMNAYARTAAERDARFNRIASVAAGGQNAAATAAGVGSNYSGQVANTYAGLGNAQAQGAINVGNAWANAAGGVATAANTGIENWMLNNRLQQNAFNSALY